MKTNTYFTLLFLSLGIIFPLSAMMSSSSDAKGQKRTFEQSNTITLSAQPGATLNSDSLSGSILKAPKASEQQANRTKTVRFNDDKQIKTYQKEKKAQSSSTSLVARPTYVRYPNILQLLPLFLRSVKDDDAESLQKLVDTPHACSNPLTGEIRIFEKFDINNLIPNENNQISATLLELAVGSNKIKSVRKLIALGAQVNKSGHPDYPPIVIATIYNHFEVVQELLKEPTLDKEKIKSALAESIKRQHTNIYTELMLHCVQHNIQTTG